MIAALPIPYPFESAEAQRALDRVPRRRGVRADDRGLPRAEADVPRRRRHRARGVRRRRCGPAPRRLAGVDRPRVRGDRSHRRGDAPSEAEGGGRPRARALLLRRHRDGRRVREPGRATLDLETLPYLFGDPYAVTWTGRRRSIGALGVAVVACDAPRRPRAVRRRDRRGLVPCRGPSRRRRSASRWPRSRRA